jgi:hypothetical protein
MRSSNGIALFIISLLSSLLIIACNSKTKSSWSAEDQKLFTETCEENSKATLGEDTSKRYCACMLLKIEAKYPNSEKAGNMPMSETLEMAKECLK